MATMATMPKICDVMAYGAKGDGVTDDTAAIAKAIAACSGTGGIVRLPHGRTFLSTPFNLTSNINLAVEGVLIAPTKPDLSRWTVLPHFVLMVLLLVPSKSPLELSKEPTATPKRESGPISCMAVREGRARAMEVAR